VAKPPQGRLHRFIGRRRVRAMPDVERDALLAAPGWGNAAVMALHFSA